MITFVEQQTKVVEFTPGTIIVDSENKENIVLIVEGHGLLHEDCFAGIPFKYMRYTDGLSKTYPNWKIYQGQVIIEN